jgi:hypothetical protein
MLKYLTIVLLAVGCHCANEQAPITGNTLGAGFSSLTGLGGSYGAFQQSLLASQPQQTFTLRAGEALPAAYGTPQVVSTTPEQQELVVQHPNPRRILVRVVKPIIFEERIVIVPYRRVTHEVRPVIEERHTVIYGKDGKQISGPAGLKAYAAGGDSIKAGSYPIGTATGLPQNTRVVSEPVYTEPIVRKVGQSLSKRTSLDYSNNRSLDERRSQRDRILNRLQSKRA